MFLGAQFLEDCEGFIEGGNDIEIGLLEFLDKHL